MKKTKVFSFLLALIMLMSVGMTACAETAGELPYVKLKYVNYGDKPASGNYDQVWAKINEMLLQDINAEIEVEWLGADSGNKLNLKYAAQEVFDFAYDANWLNHANNAAANAFRAITPEEIHQYMPLIEEQLPSIAWEEAKTNGQIFTIPSINMGFSYRVALIRGDLREKYGIEPLKTYEDLVNYCKTVVAGEGNIYGFKPVDGWLDLLQKNQWEAVSSVARDVYYDAAKAKDGVYEVFSAQYTDEYVEFCKNRREMYEAGIWAADAISDATDIGTMFANGLTCAYIDNVGTVSSRANAWSVEHPEWKLEVYNLFPENLTVYAGFTADSTSINRLAENPERTMMAMNLLQGDPRYNHLINYGIEGVNYEVTADGRRVALQADEANTYDPGCNWQFVNSVIEIPQADLYTGIQEIKETFKANAIETPFSIFTFDKTGLETEVANVTAVFSEYTALEYGMVEDVEEAVEDFRKALDAAGMPKLIEACNAQLAAATAK